MTFRLHHWVIYYLSIFSINSFADCTISYKEMSVSDSHSAPIEFGNFNMGSTYLQPVGSVLGHTVIAPHHRNANLETPLWTCDKADLPHIYFLAATNGDEPFGGHFELGNADGLPSVYATWWQYVGLKITLDGIALIRNWQKFPIRSYKEVVIKNKEKIQIRLMDIPQLEATLYRISSTPGRSKTSYCNLSMISHGSYRSGFIATDSNRKTKASCNQPSAYIQLAGEASVRMPAHDSPGEDSSKHYRFWGSKNALPFGLNTSSSTLLIEPSCVIRSNNPIVHLPKISEMALRAGQFSESNFYIDIECDNNVVSGIEKNQTAIGFKPSNAAFENAKKLNLINSNGSSDYLISDLYENNDYAKGVGIQIYNTKTNNLIRFLDQSASVGGGESSGWYPILSNEPMPTGSKYQGYTTYKKSFTARLTKIPNQLIKPGIVKSTATIIVKIQ